MALCLNCKTPGCDSIVCDPREKAATELHAQLLPLQQRALWYLAKFMGRLELQTIAEDFLLAVKSDKSATQVDPQSLADLIDFWYTR